MTRYTPARLFPPPATRSPPPSVVHVSRSDGAEQERVVRSPWPVAPSAGVAAAAATAATATRGERARRRATGAPAAAGAAISIASTGATPTTVLASTSAASTASAAAAAAGAPLPWRRTDGSPSTTGVAPTKCHMWHTDRAAASVAASVVARPTPFPPSSPLTSGGKRQRRRRRRRQRHRCRKWRGSWPLRQSRDNHLVDGRAEAAYGGARGEGHRPLVMAGGGSRSSRLRSTRSPPTPAAARGCCHPLATSRVAGAATAATAAERRWRVAGDTKQVPMHEGLAAAATAAAEMFTGGLAVVSVAGGGGGLGRRRWRWWWRAVAVVVGAREGLAHGRLLAVTGREY